jgi:hypothetical protein
VRPAFESPPPAAAGAATATATAARWLVADNVRAMPPRTRETVEGDLAAHGGTESCVALLGLAIGAFATPADALAFVDAYRRIVAYLQPVVFTDRVFLSKSSSPGAAGSGETHATVPVTCASGFFPLAALFAHSCEPNCAVTFLGGPFAGSAQLHVRPLRPVQAGEMLTVAWGGVSVRSNHSTRGRIQALRRLYGFSCCCNACAQRPDEPVSRERQEMMVKAADQYQKGRRLIRERRDLREAVAVLEQSLEVLYRHVCPPPERPMFVVAKTFDAIAQAWMLLGDRAAAAAAVRRRVAALEQQGDDGDASFEFAMELLKLAALLETAPPGSSSNSGGGSGGGDSGEAGEKVAVVSRAVQLLRRLYAPSVALDAEIKLARAI